MGFVYRLDFPNGKSYVGITIRSIQERFCAHRTAAKKKRYVIYNAWRKYGPPALVVLAQVPDGDLLAAEVNFIRSERTLRPNGYNSTPGGDISPASLPEIARKISKSRKGMIFSDAHRYNLAIAHKGLPSPKRGLPMSEAQKLKLKKAWEKRRLTPDSPETRAKKSAASIGRRRSPEAKRKTAAAKKAWWMAKRAQDTNASF